jgi:hypothetical protein
VAFHVVERSQLDAWMEHFDRHGVRHSGIAEFSELFPFAVLAFRDPDNIQKVVFGLVRESYQFARGEMLPAGVE